MGYTVRSAAWRLTVWQPFGWGVLEPKWYLNATGVELYSHAGDTGADYDRFEHANVAGAHPDVVASLGAQMVEAQKRNAKACQGVSRTCRRRRR